MSPPTHYPRQVAAGGRAAPAQRHRRPLRASRSETSHYRRALETTEHGGYLARSTTCSRIIDGPLVWAPGLDGGVLVSLRGGDFVFDSGQDLSIGYDSHDAERVRLYLEESFSFQAVTPDAAVALVR